MAIYPEPTSNDTAGIFEYFRYVNNVADGLFFPSILLVLWVVIFIATKQFTSARAWTTASAICALLSIPLVVMDLVGRNWMYLLIVLTAIGILWLKLETGKQ